MSIHSDDSDGMLCGSSYEILTDSTLLTDDEEDGGSSVASLDDNLSLDDTDSLCGLPSDSEHHDPHPIPSFGGLDEHHLDESEMTLREDHSPSGEIVFDEPEDVFEEHISVCRNLTSFTEAETTELSRHIRFDDSPPQILYSTVRQTMTKEVLIMDEPLRVLYIGHPSAKDEISRKLGAALAAVHSAESCSSSWDTVKSPKFSIVPISSFGSRSISPEVELVDNNGPEIVLDECTSAKASRNMGQPDSLSLWLNGTNNVCSVFENNGIQLESSGWKLPHLAVVYCADDDDDVTRRMTRCYARSFMARHSVPTLVISQSPLYEQSTESYTLDSKSVHISIESDTLKAGHRIHKRIPVDLSTFIELNPRQLNRNLGCITGLVSETQSEISPALVGKPPSASTNLMLLRDVEKTQNSTNKSKLAWISYTRREDVWKFFLIGWLFLFMVAGATITFAYTKYSTSPIPEPVMQPVTAIATVQTILIKPSTKNAVLSTTSTQSRGSLASVSPFFPKADVDTQLYGSKIAAMNESDQFQIHILEKNHLVIRPPQKYLLLKKAPRLYVDVTRDSVSIPAELSWLFDGVFDLKIDDEEAWGLLKVSIRTKSKPIIQETLEVDLGRPWLQVSQWMKAVEQGRTELQVFLGKTTNDAKEIAKDLSKTAGNQAVDIKDVFLVKAKEYTDGVSGGLSKLYQESKALSQFLLPGERKEHHHKALQMVAGILLKGVFCLSASVFLSGGVHGFYCISFSPGIGLWLGMTTE
ncbi:hypothetical protein EDC01DRAFT_12129 [Geopyxis carbonaria]|nr:hypothetical protein EDC01DRAFT_12129 [Geopyxis carbonaria]